MSFVDFLHGVPNIQYSQTADEKPGRAARRAILGIQNIKEEAGFSKVMGMPTRLPSNKSPAENFTRMLASSTCCCSLGDNPGRPYTQHRFLRAGRLAIEQVVQGVPRWAPQTAPPEIQPRTKLRIRGTRRSNSGPFVMSKHRTPLPRKASRRLKCSLPLKISRKTRRPRPRKGPAATPSPARARTRLRALHTASSAKRGVVLGAGRPGAGRRCARRRRDCPAPR